MCGIWQTHKGAKEYNCEDPRGRGCQFYAVPGPGWLVEVFCRVLHQCRPMSLVTMSTYIIPGISPMSEAAVQVLLSRVWSDRACREAVIQAWRCPCQVCATPYYPSLAGPGPGFSNNSWMCDRIGWILGKLRWWTCVISSRRFALRVEGTGHQAPDVHHKSHHRGCGYCVP